MIKYVHKDIKNFKLLSKISITEYHKNFKILYVLYLKLFNRILNNIITILLILRYCMNLCLV